MRPSSRTRGGVDVDKGKQDDEALDMERYAVITILGRQKSAFRVRTA